MPFIVEYFKLTKKDCTREESSAARGEARGFSETQGPLWSSIADTWAEMMEPRRTPLYEAMLDAGGVKSGSCTLDAGCGSGAAARRVDLRGAKVAGLDASEGIIARARRQVPAGDFRIGDLEALPFDDDSFDAVVASDSVQFAENKVAAIAELGRVCRPAGTVVISLWDEPEKNDQSVVFSAMADAMPEPPKGGPFALSRHGLLEDMIRNAGLTVTGGDSVPLENRFSTLDEFWLVTGSSGPSKAMIRVVGEAKLKNAAFAAAGRFVQPSGEVVFRNAFRFVTATP